MIARIFPVLSCLLIGCSESVEVLTPRAKVAEGTQMGLASGVDHACAIVAGDVHCWGSNDEGALGLGRMTGVSLPKRVEALSSISAVVAGDAHTCALDEAGAISCFGRNESGQLGTGDFDSRNEPTRITGTLEFVAIASHYAHVCAIAGDGSLWCWGDNDEGQLGLGDGTAGDDRSRPTQVGTERDWIEVDTGQGHTCGVRNNGTLWCWGRNTAGQLAQDPLILRLESPAQVGVSEDWIDVIVAQEHSCGVKEDGHVWCWGNGEFGQRGAGDDRDVRYEPALVDVGPIASLSANTFSACVLESNGNLACTGRNSEGQLGVGDNDDRAVFTSAGVDNDWIAISAGRFFTCAEKKDGRVFCAGDNSSGQLGIDDGIRRNVFGPVE